MGRDEDQGGRRLVGGATSARGGRAESGDERKESEGDPTVCGEGGEENEERKGGATSTFKDRPLLPHGSRKKDEVRVALYHNAIRRQTINYEEISFRQFRISTRREVSHANGSM